MRNTQTADQPVDDYHALLLERFGPVAVVTRERASTPAELIRLPQRRRQARNLRDAA